MKCNYQYYWRRDDYMDLEKKQDSFNFLINNVMRITKSATSKNDKLKKICDLLKNSVPYYDWVGFYISNESKTELNLGPYSGEPTEHTKIPFGKGICGQAADKKETLVVQDVSLENNYLSCSPTVRSEIVVPLFKNGEIIGELDIDSHTIEPFSEEDSQFLENVCNIVAQLF
jgi:GAF domain-containing protein